MQCVQLCVRALHKDVMGVVVRLDLLALMFKRRGISTGASFSMCCLLVAVIKLVTHAHLFSIYDCVAGTVGTGSRAEESGDGAQAGSQCHHEHTEEALHQGLQPQAVRPVPQSV